MRIGHPTNPFHIARAYGVNAPTEARIEAPRPAQAVRRDVDAAEGRTPSGVDRLVGAVVPGAIDFRGPEPKPSEPALPMYRRPADLNAAATSVQAGRVIDLRA